MASTKHLAASRCRQRQPALPYRTGEGRKRMFGLPHSIWNPLVSHGHAMALPMALPMACSLPETAETAALPRFWRMVRLMRILSSARARVLWSVPQGSHWEHSGSLAGASWHPQTTPGSWPGSDNEGTFERSSRREAKTTSAESAMMS